MRIIPSGVFRIISNDKQVLEYDLSSMECSSYDGDEYNDYFMSFNYSEIFQYILEHVKLDITVPESIKQQDYSGLNSREDFHRSKLWLDLGFKISDDFKILMAIKEVKIEYYMSYGQKAGTIIDFENEVVIHDASNMIRNALDNFIFEWSNFYTEDGNELSGRDILDKLMNIYLKNEVNNIDYNVRELFSNLYHELSDDDDSANKDTPITEDELQGIIEIMVSK